MARLEYIPIPLKNYEAFCEMEDDQIGAVVMAALEYAIDGRTPQGFDRFMMTVFRFLKGDIDRVRESIEEESQRKRENALKRWDSSVNAVASENAGASNNAVASENAGAAKKKESKNQRTNEPKNEKNHSDVIGNGVNGRRGRKQYEIPTVDDVTAYCVEIGCETVDPAYFCEYYGKQNWKINGTPVHDWKAILRTWAANDSRKAVPASSSPTSSFDAEEMWADAVAASYADLDYSEDGA